MTMFDAVSRFRSMRIARTDFVVEIGSGNDPYWRSDLLIDKYVADSTERPGRVAGLVVDRPLVIGDALQLPLKDKSVDFLIARNLLEHIIDVAQFAAELQRVSRRGYISTPSSVAEKLFGWDKHVWFVSKRAGRLHLLAKDRTLFDAELNRAFHTRFATSRAFQRFYRADSDLFVVQYLWDGALEYTVEGATAPLQEVKAAQAEFDLASTTQVLAQLSRPANLRRRAATFARRLHSTQRMGAVAGLLDRLACPVCHGALVLHGAGLRCGGCARGYPIVNGVPVLVAEAGARQP